VIPLGDDTPTVRTPVATYTLIAINFAVWLLYQHGGFDAQYLATTVCNTGMVPGELTHLAPLGTAVPMGMTADGHQLVCQVDNDPINILTPLISMFLHGGWLHILANMLYLWVFGKSVEDGMGRGRFVVFYLICGLIAAATHVAFNPSSPVPTVGASGAISGVMGAYLVMYPRAWVRMFFIIFIIRFPAWLVLIWWFLTQALAGVNQLNEINPGATSSVAVWAHVGGFIAGAVLAKFFVNPDLMRQRDYRLSWRTVPS
jgi:membrane associated rhomboid family serine protease